MKRLPHFLLLVLFTLAVPSFSSAQQPVYWTLTCQTELHASASDNAMRLAVASTGQIVLVKTTQANGWANIAYTDDHTGMRFDGWICVGDLSSPPQPYDHTLSNAQAEAAARLDAFQARMDLSTAKPDFLFDGWVEEYFYARSFAVVDSGEIYIRVDQIHAESELDEIDYFVVYDNTQTWIDQAPVVGRLNATAFDAETKLPTAFEGVMDYTLGSEQVRVVPVFRDSGISEFEILLMPAGGLVRESDASGAGKAIFGTPHKDLPLMDFEVTDTGRRGPDDEYILQIQITARDGSLSQALEIATRDPDFSYGPFFLRDMNFDGYLDLDITVGLGARNRFSVVSLWLPDEHCFAKPLADTELCNYILDPKRKEIWSSISDGWAYRDHTRYAWEGNRLIPEMRAESYYAGDPDLIGERVTEISSIDGSLTVLWDEQYPLDWYGGSYAWVERERYDVLLAVVFYDMLYQNPQYAVVANVDWVNLRHMERKSSDSIGKINAGETVQILRYGCGEDQGWVRVLWNGRTGYIWHSFLSFWH